MTRRKTAAAAHSWKKRAGGHSPSPLLGAASATDESRSCAIQIRRSTTGCLTLAVGWSYGDHNGIKYRY